MPLAQLPPMGWNSWNTFGWQINEQLIFEMADLMASQGYREAGYEYLVLLIIAACIKCGTEMTIECDGEDEQAALAKAVELVESGLGE